MHELLTALRANWEGHEEMRQDFLNAPKFGNDDDFADDWAVKLHVRMEETMNRIKDAWGNTATIDGSVAGANVIYGLQCGATPDGRLSMDPCADGTRSPLAGFDKKGPTAVLNSAGKIPFLHTELMNQRFMPQFLEGDNKKLFAGYLREWYEQGTIPHVQFNVVGGGELRRAQEEPERHSELIVRVAGYSAHFVDLPKVYQDSIIDRTEQCLG